MSGEDDLFDYDYQPGGGDAGIGDAGADDMDYFPPGGAEAPPARENYASMDQFYAEDGETGGASGTAGQVGSYGEDDADGIEGTKRKGIFGDRMLNLGCLKIKLNEIPLPLVDPDWFHTVKTSKQPWQILLTYAEWILSFFVFSFNLIAYIYFLIVLGKNATVGTFDIINIFVTVIYFVTQPMLNFFGKYLPIFKAMTGGGLSRSLLIVYFFFNIASGVVYVCCVVGVLGSVGVIQFFELVKYMKRPEVGVFGVFAAVNILAFVILFCANMTIFVAHVIGCIKSVQAKRQGGLVEGGDGDADI